MKSRKFSSNPLSVTDSAKSRPAARMSDGNTRWDLMSPRIVQVYSACSILGYVQYNSDDGSGGVRFCAVESDQARAVPFRVDFFAHLRSLAGFVLKMSRKSGGGGLLAAD